MSDKSIEEEIMIKAQKAKRLARYMSSTQDLVEGQIEKAMKRGDFNNLEGSGKPLNFDENPYEPPEMRMVIKILKDNDFAPYWVELGKEIDAGQARLRSSVEAFKSYTRMTYSQKRSSGALHRFDKRKAAFYAESREHLEVLSKKILDYNLHCPTFRLGRSNFTVDDEMYQIIHEIETYIQELIDTI
ncbi:MAG: DUF1992 domain-containing protein [Syntrophomonadaceae bacterium]